MFVAHLIKKRRKINLKLFLPDFIFVTFLQKDLPADVVMFALHIASLGHLFKMLPTKSLCYTKVQYVTSSYIRGPLREKFQLVRFATQAEFDSFDGVGFCAADMRRQN